VGQLHGLGGIRVNQRIFCLGVIFNYKILCHIILKYDTLSPVSHVGKKKKKKLTKLDGMTNSAHFGNFRDS
jgi:hypothetical protein